VEEDEGVQFVVLLLSPFLVLLSLAFFLGCRRVSVNI
jgi:hypothetical protein